MPQITESNITLNFPDANYFRFQDCAGYAALSGAHFKEMDACWYDAAANEYWLFELKDFSLASLALPADIDSRAWAIVKKAVDSLCMFLSAKHGYAYSAQLNSCLPAIPNAATVFRFITIVHCTASQKPNVQLLHNSFRNKFKPYAQVFDISHYGVVEHSSAIRTIPNNLVQ